MSIGEELEKVQRRETSFDAFWRTTRREWSMMAVALYRRWERQLPPAISVQDVEQELLLGAWVAVRRWKPGKASLPAFVIWTAQNRTKKWLHKQRGTNQHTRKGPSTFAYCVSMLAKDGQPDMPDVIERALSGEVSREEAEDYADVLSGLHRATTSEAGAHAIRCFVAAAGDFDKASSAFVADEDARLLFRVRSKRQARRLIEDELRSVRRVFAA
jgi:hypothetical protein